MKTITSILFISVIVSACSTQTTVPTPTKPQPPAPAHLNDIGYCDAAEANLKALGCIPQGAYTDKGKSFTVFCQETETNGVSLNARCLSTITSCAQENSCTGS